MFDLCAIGISKMPVKNKKYIFIDTNIYCGLFLGSEEFSDEFFKLISNLAEKTGTSLLMPQQVKDEIERNYIDEWFVKSENSLKNKIKNLDARTNKLDLEYASYSKSAVSRIKKDIQKEKKNILKQMGISRKQFLSPRSSARVKLNKLLKIIEPIEDTQEICEKAFYRRQKGNPPKDREDKLGDKIIWESLLDYLNKKSKEKPILIFVARDNNAWKSEVSSKLEFNLWLQKEYKQKTSGKVILVENLSQIPGLMPEEQQKIKEEEEKEKKRNITSLLKTAVPEKFRTVHTFAEAEKLMMAVGKRMDMIDIEGIEEILKASIENNEFTAGPYNQVIDAGGALIFFNNLFNKSKELGMDLTHWKNFYSLLDERQQERFYNIKKMLKEDGIEIEPKDLKYVGVEDIPF